MNSQPLLFPDPRPLVERLGAEFFRSAPESPGVYLMRDAADIVLYVGKARNLRKRLGSYRVANPDRMARRHLRLLRSVARIELQQCADETSALARESELLRALRPRFNRAGTWPGTPRFLAWRVTPDAVELAVTRTIAPGWRNVGPLGGGAEAIRAALVRLLWCAIHVERRFSEMPHAWFQGRHTGVTALSYGQSDPPGVAALEEKLEAVCHGDPGNLAAWVRDRTSAWSHPFELAVREADLETVADFATRQVHPKSHAHAWVAVPDRKDRDRRDACPTPNLFSPP